VLLFTPSANVLGALSIESNSDLSVRVFKTDSSIKIDGVLEQEWFSASPISAFIQMMPVSGQPTSQETYVYFLQDEKNLYVAFDCRDTALDSIYGRVERRDQINFSDAVTLYLDTFNDKRNGYFFKISAGGVKKDGTISNENWFDPKWDGIWNSAVKKNSNGWIVELEIPFKTLRYGGEDITEWGVCLNRTIIRRDELSSWPEVHRNIGVRAGNFAKLKGLDIPKAGKHFELLPHAVGRWDGDEESDLASKNEWENVGLSGKMVINPNWTMNMVYQPDFAQVEVDNAIINLSDYPVFLAERRPFFVESLSLFNSSMITTLHTRRISDPEYGIRLNGHQGKLRTSILHVQDIASSDDDQINGMQQSVSALRMLWNIGEASRIGLTTTSLERDDFHARSMGLDSRVRWGLRNYWKIDIVGVDRSGERENPFSVENSLNLSPTLETGIMFANGFRGREYNINDLGWGRYSNQIWNWLQTSYSTYPIHGSFEQLNFLIRAYQESFANGKFPFGNIEIESSLKLKNKLRFGISSKVGNHLYRNYVDEDEGEFGELQDNFGVFNPEMNKSFYHRVWFSTDSRKKLDFDISSNFSSYRDGKRIRVNTQSTYKPRSNLDLTAEYDWKQIWGAVSLNGSKRTNFQIYRLKIKYSLTLNSFFRGTIQYVDDQEITENSIQGNFLWAWNWNPGSWLYVVYDEQRYEDYYKNDSMPFRYSGAGNRTIRVKGTYFFTPPT
jgi:Domain of unknown function (DUF5916)/Carbohydrate family 9 binding domain-like